MKNIPPPSFEYYDGPARTTCIRQDRAGQTSIVVLEPDELAVLHAVLEADLLRVTPDSRGRSDRSQWCDASKTPATTSKSSSPRYGCEVYVSQTGQICIKQERYLDGPYPEDVILSLHPEETLFLIDALRETYREVQGCPPPAEPPGLGDQPTENHRPSR